eukprot:TRINITY_DN2238_c4_g1_i1.p1 TRINITY_DN2238_c4_g1~~TRINITY_DN2238_c4_g1_i1.p1  ORF type:complete len:289 (-),score=60.21 TRINITY_DN2238_c4_g1_i1:222-1088(-)
MEQRPSPLSSSSMPCLIECIVYVRGAGELASGVIHRLHRSGFKVVASETEYPLAVRRCVSFCEVVHEPSRSVCVEGVVARLVESVEAIEEAWKDGEVAIVVDPKGNLIHSLRPQVVIDATIDKKNTPGTHLGMGTEMTIGLGCGFVAKRDVDVVIETNRGHDLGRVIYEGHAAADTGIPGVIAGYAKERILRAPIDGEIELVHELGDIVEAGEVVMRVSGAPIAPIIGGCLRGLIRNGMVVTKGTKVGDIDPRREVKNLRTISDKARTISGGVLEAILAHFHSKRLHS